MWNPHLPFTIWFYNNSIPPVAQVKILASAHDFSSSLTHNILSTRKFYCFISNIYAESALLPPWLETVLSHLGFLPWSSSSQLFLHITAYSQHTRQGDHLKCKSCYSFVQCPAKAPHFRVKSQILGVSYKPLYSLVSSFPPLTQSILTTVTSRMLLQ